jgi:hypothetical protein
MLIGSEIHELGFALACDFLKECGYTKYAKPDRHIKYIFKGLNIVNDKADDYQIFKAVVKFAKVINQEPYVVDKLFWLIGSGKFYLDEIKIKTNRKEFVEKTKLLISEVRLLISEVFSK